MLVLASASLRRRELLGRLGVEFEVVTSGADETAPEGMAPDGVAGALTLIRLNLRLDQGLPRLSKTVLGGLSVLHP